LNLLTLSHALYENVRLPVKYWLTVWNRAGLRLQFSGSM